MTPTAYKALLNDRIDSILTTGDVTDTQKRSVVDQMITNLNVEIVNPDKDTYPVKKG